MSKAFASTADVAEKKASFILGSGLAPTGEFLTALYGSVGESAVKGLALTEVFDRCNHAIRPQFCNFDPCQSFNAVRAYN